MPTCQECGSAPATVYTLCCACRHKALRQEVRHTLSRIGGGGAARPLPREVDEERARALQAPDEDADSEGEEIDAP